MPRTLYLHAGHVKTGSTALQAAFAVSAGRLAALGIDYPALDDAAREIDHDTMTPVGNGRTFAADPAAYLARAGARAAAGRHMLVSSELISQDAPPGLLPRAVAAAREAGFERVALLLFCRDPLPLAVSMWQQSVKGWQAETRDLDDWVAEAFDLPERIAAFLDAARATEGLALTARSYRRARLVGCVADWLGVPEETLAHGAGGAGGTAAGRSVNRALTRSEAALQRALNAALGRSGDVFAFRIVHRLPEVPPDPPRVNPAVWAERLADLSEALDRIDAALPAGETLDRALPEPAPPAEPYTFSAEQLAVIAEGLAAHAARARARAEVVPRQALPRRVWRRLARLLAPAR